MPLHITNMKSKLFIAIIEANDCKIDFIVKSIEWEMILLIGENFSE